MGLDLKVLASHFRERRGEMLPTAMLRFDRDTAIFSQLTVETTPCIVHLLPDGLSVGLYTDEGLRYASVDQHNNRLTFTTPADPPRS